MSIKNRDDAWPSYRHKSVGQLRRENCYEIHITDRWTYVFLKSFLIFSRDGQIEFHNEFVFRIFLATISLFNILIFENSSTGSFYSSSLSFFVTSTKKVSEGGVLIFGLQVLTVKLMKFTVIQRFHSKYLSQKSKIIKLHKINGRKFSWTEFLRISHIYKCDFYLSVQLFLIEINKIICIPVGKLIVNKLYSGQNSWEMLLFQKRVTMELIFYCEICSTVLLIEYILFYHFYFLLLLVALGYYKWLSINFCNLTLHCEKPRIDFKKSRLKYLQIGT